MNLIWIYIGVAITMAAWSFLYKESILFRWAERTYLSAAIGHSVVVGIYTLRDRYYPITVEGKYLLIIPAILGYFYLFIISKKFRWVARYPIAITMGVGLASQAIGTISADFIGQILGIIREGGRIFGTSPQTAFTSALTIIVTLFSLSYFIFTVKTTGTFGQIYTRIFKISQYCLMAALGAMAGNYILGTGLAITVATIQRIIFALMGLG
jgi:hypothetical protein